jgi:hypothetical protein
LPEKGVTNVNLTWISLLMQFLPVALQAIIAVETSIKNAPGASKKEVVMDIITAGTDAATKIPDAHVQQISGLVDVIVGSLNKSGAFNQTPAK